MQRFAQNSRLARAAALGRLNSHASCLGQWAQQTIGLAMDAAGAPQGRGTAFLEQLAGIVETAKAQARTPHDLDRELFAALVRGLNETYVQAVIDEASMILRHKQEVS